MAASLSLLAVPAFAQPAPSDVPLADARRGFETTLVGDVKLEGESPPRPPAFMFERVRYPSPAGDLVAYLSPDPSSRRSAERGATQGERRRYPAVVWCHLGFDGIGSELWEDPQYVSSYSGRDFVVLCPSWRGANGNPGRFEMFYGEVEDARAAIDYLATLPYVDPERIYLVGFHMGGTVALLTALTEPPNLRAAFSVGGVPDLSLHLEEDAFYGVAPPFEAQNPREVFLRSPTFFVQHLRVPTWHFEGEASPFAEAALVMGERAARAKAPLHVRIVAGGHQFNVLEPISELLARELAGDTKPALSLQLTKQAVQAAFEAHPNVADFFADQGYQVIDSDPRRARELFDRALEVDPSHLDGLVNRGVLNEREGKLRPALADLDEALEVAPDDFWALYNRGIVQHRLGRYEDAIGDYTRAIAINPRDSQAYSSRGFVRVDTNDPEGAREDFAQALILDPDNVEAREGNHDLKGRQQIQTVTDSAVTIAAPISCLSVLAVVAYFVFRTQKARQKDLDGRVGYREAAGERRRGRAKPPRRKAEPLESDSEPIDDFELVGSDADEEIAELHDSTEDEE